MKYLDFLENVPLFAGLSPTDLQALLETLRVEREAFAAGEILLRTGEVIDRFGILLAGRVEIVKENFEGNQTLVAQITPGHIFAEAFACSRAPLTVTVQAGRSGLSPVAQLRRSVCPARRAGRRLPADRAAADRKLCFQKPLFNREDRASGQAVAAGKGAVLPIRAGDCGRQPKL